MLQSDEYQHNGPQVLGVLRRINDPTKLEAESGGLMLSAELRARRSRRNFLNNVFNIFDHKVKICIRSSKFYSMLQQQKIVIFVENKIH